MSPQSMIPLILPSSSTSALSSVTSPWITCERSAGHRGHTSCANRSRTRSTSARCAGSPIASAIGRSAAACCTSHNSTRPADGWKNDRIARPSRAIVTPWSYNASPPSSRGSADARPGMNELIRTRCPAPSAPATSVTYAPGPSAGSAPRSGIGCASGSEGSAARACNAASVSMSTIARCSDAFEIFRTPAGPSGPSIRNPWSRSLPSG